MITYDSALEAILDAATTKQEWCTALINALGPNRTVTCKRDGGINPEDPFTTGTTFYQSALTGAMRVSGGTIADLGTTSGATVKLPADLASGKSVLRIEGNGHWIQGTLGLQTSTADFRVKKNPTEKTGMAFRNVSISARADLPSGTGNPTPNIDPANPANANKVPVLLEWYDWRNPAAPFLVDSINLNVRGEDLIFEDTEIAEETGDVLVTMCDKTIVYDEFEIGAIMMSMNASVNAEANVPVHQVAINFKPYGSWPTYPFTDTCRPDRDRTVPRSYKAVLKAADGTVIHIFQMRDGLPINSPEQSQRFAEGYGAVRPFVDCAKVLVWQSHLTKPSTKLKKWFSGVPESWRRPSMAKDGTSTNGVLMYWKQTQQFNAPLQLYACPEWPLRFDPNIGGGGTADINAQQTFDDPYLYDIRSYHGGEGNLSAICGWNYEPGSVSCHDWFTGPGGPRHDRAPIPSPLMLFVSDPNGVRVKGSVPYRTLCHAYGRAYFNQSSHWFTDVGTFTGMPKDFILEGKMALGGPTGYYNQRFDLVPGGLSRHIEPRSATNRGALAAPTRDGTMWHGGWNLDYMHSYCAPGLWAMAFNSPLHVISARARFAAHSACQMGAGGPLTDPTSRFLCREHAWRWLQYTVMWKIGTKHYLGMDRASIENTCVIELEGIHDTVYHETKVANNPALYYEGIRRFGLPAVQNQSTDGQGRSWRNVSPITDTKAYYFSHILVMMRQFGLFKVLRAKSEKCAKALDFIIECLDRHCIDMFHVTEGRQNNYMPYTPTVPASEPYPEMTANSWEEWNLTVYPKNGQEDYIRKPDGTVTTSEVSAGQNATMSLRAQWVMARRDYFPEYAHPRLAGVCTMVQGFYDTISERVAAAATPTHARWSDWNYLWPSLGALNPPTELVNI